MVMGEKINVNRQLWIIQKSNKSIHNNTGRLYRLRDRGHMSKSVYVRVFKSVYVRVFYDLELLRYVLSCAIERQL